MSFHVFIKLIFVIGILSGCSTVKKQKPKNLLRRGDFAVFVAPSGVGIACKGAIKTDCGLTLFQCADGVIFYCAQNVLILTKEAIEFSILNGPAQ